MSCSACDKESPLVKYYYVNAEKKNGDKIQFKVNKADYERIIKMKKENPGAKLILKD